MSHYVEQSGFFPTEVQGHLRPSAQIIQWNIAAPNPSGRRHVESGSYRKTAHLQNCGGFTAQQESGVALDFGRIALPGGGSGFDTATACITFNMGELNKNVFSRFDRLFNRGSGEGSEDLTCFNFRMWIGNLSAFDVVAYSGLNRNPIHIDPVFHYRESAEWRQRYRLELTEVSGGVSGAPQVPVSGVAIVPSSMPEWPNVFARENEVMVSGAYLDREFSNFVYLRGNFPDLPSGSYYKLGTYGGLGQKDFTLKFSYDYTRLDSNILVPTDIVDFPLSVVRGYPPQSLHEGLSGWWQMNESSPKLSQMSGFHVDDGYTFAQTTMTLQDAVEGGGSVGRHTGIVSSGTASGYAANLRSWRRDFIGTTSTDPVTMDFDGTDTDGHTGFTFTGWVCLNDPSGADPAATGVGARIPSLDTGILCRWNYRFALQSLQYRAWYSMTYGRFFMQVRNKDNRSPWFPYHYLHVDDQDNGHGEWDSFGNIEGQGGGVEKHRWYFLSFGYDPNGDSAGGGDLFFRVNDGPIERQSFCSHELSLIGVGGSTAQPPFHIGASFTRTAGNGSIAPGAGQYDNWTLHRRPLTNREMLDLYNAGRGQEYPVGRDRVLNYDLPPEQAIIDVDPDPMPLRRALRSWYNFSDASGVLMAADSQRYTNLEPNNSQIQAGAISGNFMPTSGIIIDEFPHFTDLATASGALQIRSGAGPGFEDGQPGNNVWWEATTSAMMAAIGDCNFTWAAWVRFPKAGDTECVMAQWTAAGNYRYWILYKDASNNMRFDRARGNTIGAPGVITTPPEFAASFTPGRWYFVFVQSENTGGAGDPEMTWTLNVYDPVQQQTFSNSQVSDYQQYDMVTTVPITFGAYETLGTANVADIDIAGAGMWRRKLSTTEIQWLINSGNGLNFGAANFGRITRVYWDSQRKRDGDPATV
jgi:hypothetical protein